MASWYNTLKNFGIIIKDVFWFMDSNERTRRSVQAYLDRNINIAISLVNKNKLPYWPKHKTDPDKIIKLCYDWVCKNIRYRSDELNFGRADLWEDIDIAVDNETADCETMATIIYALARVHHVNPLMLYFCAGRMENGEGHAWLEYYSETKDDWYIVDAAYAPNLTTFRKVSSDTRYVERWFRVAFI